ncbi:hypothetical protein BJV82DRAFT_632350 [Fennellomyces sp. T-0311]|nr:hypothetical protein BJV82DRAFT_632350 [Fennellomyces sp. T-0311]
MYDLQPDQAYYSLRCCLLRPWLSSFHSVAEEGSWIERHWNCLAAGFRPLDGKQMARWVIANRAEAAQ